MEPVTSPLGALLDTLLAAGPVAEPAFNATELTALTRLPSWALGLVGVVLLATVVASTLNTRGAKGSVRLALTALRLLLAISVMALLLEPGLRRMATSREANRVILAVDTSQSMAQVDDDEPPRVRQAVAAAEELAKELASRDVPFVVEWMRFDENVRPLLPVDRQNLLAGAAAPEGDQTHLAAPLDVMDDGGEGGQSRPIGGVVLFSDGADTRGLSAALSPDVLRKLGKAGVPVHTVLLGDPAAFKDVALERVIADDFAFVRNKLRFSVNVRHTGFEGLEVPFSVKEDGQPLLVETKVLDGPGQTEVTFEIEPRAAGKHIYTVSVPTRPDEAIAENNRIDFPLKVIRDRIRVLQVAGRPSWDERFVRRLLKENPSVDLISFFILRSPTDNANADPSELSLIPFPTRELFTEELHTFDVIILQDFNYRPYQMAVYLRNIRDFVKQEGGGLLMIGGSLSFSEGEYDGTAIAEVLPVKLYSGHGHLSEEPFRPLLTTAGRTHPVTDLGELAPGDNPFARLPPLEGVNLVPGLMDGAETLLAHPFLNAAGEPHPVVAVREVGAGRSMAILTDSTWSWSLPHVGAGGRGDVHRRLFANALRWLIRDPELSRAKVQVQGTLLDPDEPIALEVRTYDPSYGPQPETPVRLTFERLDATGDTPAPIAGATGADGTARFTVPAPGPGAYRVQVVAGAEGKTIGSDIDAFVVRAARAETLFAEPRKETLAALAGASGGRLVSPDDVTSLPFVDHEIERVHRQRTEPLWSSLWVVALIALLAGAEWWWRRRRGFA
jgi:uncharacterized membrane protein